MKLIKQGYGTKTHIILIIAIILILTILHYITPVHLPLLHDMYRRLYYIPIIYAGFIFGIKGALSTAFTVSVLFFPHIIHRWGEISLQTYDAVFEIIIYFIVAATTGFLVESERRKNRELTQVREELAHIISQSLKKETPIKRISKKSLKLHFDLLIGESKGMHDVYSIITKTINKKINVLIQGESGTGKELVAKAFHNYSDRNENAFIAVNCAAIPESLLESELFGYKKGAFTGAETDKAGKFKLANKGTLFLDEISSMPLNLQAKLLRVLQSEEINPIGSEVQESIDIRVIAATNENLLDMVEKKLFRADLYYRINVINIEIPSLRKRPGDIPLLVQYFLKKHGGQDLSISETTIKILESHKWPGNVRELENIIQRAIALNHGSVILPENIPLDRSYEGIDSKELSFTIPDDGVDITAVERSLIQKAITKTKGNQTQAAKLLGLSRAALMYRCQKFKINFNNK